MCAALAFLNPTEVEKGGTHPQCCCSMWEIKCVFDKFIEQWFDSPRLSIKTRNCTGRRHQANNAVERWNHRLNTILGKPHSRIKNLIDTLENYVEKSDIKFTRVYLNLEGVRRKHLGRCCVTRWYYWSGQVQSSAPSLCSWLWTILYRDEA